MRGISWSRAAALVVTTERVLAGGPAIVAARRPDNEREAK